MRPAKEVLTVKPGPQLTSEQINQLAMEFAKAATFHRIEDRGSADIVYEVKHHARFFFELLDHFDAVLTELNELREA
jgi:hypothetical protein